MSEVPQKFKTSDGREFTEKGAAEQYEELLVAQRAYDAARKSVARLLASTLTTADGKPFEFGRDYLYIIHDYFGLSGLRRVSISPWRFNFTPDGSVILTDSVSTEDATYQVDQLYATQAAADRALLEVQERELAAYVERVGDLRRRVIPATAEVAE